MKDKHRKDQLERFFRHNPVEDPLYLKKYVKEHPDNKMAWYLLGREYANKGEQGKASYCFAQAGDVYEAFERQTIEIEEGSERKARQGPEQRVNKRMRRVGAGLAALLFMLPLSASGDIGSRGPDVADRGQAASIQAAAEADAVERETASSGESSIYYWAKQPGSSGLGDVLQQLLLPRPDAAKQELLVEGETTADGKWLLWYKQPRPLLTMQRHNAGADQVLVRYHDPAVCNCQSETPAATVQHTVAAWQGAQEAQLVLRSAIAAYRQRAGAWPDTAEALHQPYPNNLLPGVTPAMQEQFPRALAELSAGPQAAASPPQPTPPAGAGPQPGAGAKGASLSAPLARPLEIIVDKQKHRLALVSGNTIVRSYLVGLGGPRTPEGEFVISEKVRNPNGRSNGEFGSRGMTLSDTLYAIHGTNKPSSIGKDQSLGCVRMAKADVEELFDMIPLQTKVTIGNGLLPDEGPGQGLAAGGAPNSDRRFQVPLQTEERNPGKRYKWLD